MSKNLNRQHGHAIIELALIIPLILALSLTGLEYSRQLKYIQASATFSREAASIALRDCAAFRKKDAVLAQRCLQDAQKQIENIAKQIHFNTEIVLSLYRYTGDTYKEAITSSGDKDCAEEDQFQLVATVAGSSKSSRITLNDKASSFTDESRIDNRILCSNRAIVVAEVFIPFVSIAPTFIQYDDPREFYDATVM